ncbi:ribosome small subunit-dependent GTPase A [Anaerostipes sp. 992a]|uniref:ribosome small subunit-dependent GTPase A n=1 Tax=Anaerostipes sp. 992a TaxID=1261637 RepID=UPI000951E705|nr:ribosome small subunit-dependent GTPase A [Anaerostipes sp. 992a]OLR61962.1 ribosome small subunit-dependent GTPase A [Anaerostipes sp. 992a]
MNTIKLEDYGLTEERWGQAGQDKGGYIGRVLSQSRDLYRVISEQGELLAKISGKFRYEVKNQTDYPAVGDFVVMDRSHDANGNGIIHCVLPRKSVFLRKSAGIASKEQVIAANVDTVFLCMSMNQDYNLRRMERYLTLAWESGAIPVIVLTKADLCNDVYEKLCEVAAIAPGVDILDISTHTKGGWEKIRPYLAYGKTAAFLGSSGVGKSTLINCLLGRKVLDTQVIRQDDKGRHTTTRRELLLLPEGGILMDTPGMRELGMWDEAEGLERTFTDVESYFDKCRFRNCTHTNEPGCAIHAAINAGELSKERWDSYCKLRSEDAYLEDRSGYMQKKKEKFKSIAKINRKKK